jgi:uncharacterized protein (TIGR01777 family)
LEAAGYDTVSLGRSKADITWDPARGQIEAGRLEGFEAIIHLAGDNIAEGRWTAAKKERILRSRVDGTKLLAETVAGLKTPPSVVVSASAIGYYGDRGEEALTETSAPGMSFLADVCREWEKAADPLAQKNIRVVHPRIGIVLSREGGALAKMLPPFKMGVGGNLGSGRQYMSWIDLDDLTGVLLTLVRTPSLRGPVNAVTPFPVTNAEFTKTMGSVLSRPTIFPMPAFAARLVFGEMADALLLASTRVEPTKLESIGHSFKFPRLDSSLRHQLNA